MIRLLVATEDQYNALNGYAYNSSKINFIHKEGIGHYVGESVLTDENFLSIRPQLQELSLLELKEIEFKAIIEGQ